MDPPASRRPIRVFLSHSSGDKPKVRDLYRRLAREEGIRPWLDEEDLVPGQDWDREIRRAVRDSMIVIVCLSQASVSNAGYLQREISYALDVADQQPEGTIFLIPLKLEECEAPERLRRLHWVNYYEETGYERLLRALRVRADAAVDAAAPSSMVDREDPDSPDQVRRQREDGLESASDDEESPPDRAPRRVRRSSTREPTVNPQGFSIVGICCAVALVSLALIAYFQPPNQSDFQKEIYRGLYALLAAGAIGAFSGYANLQARVQAVGQSFVIAGTSSVAIFILVYLIAPSWVPGVVTRPQQTLTPLAIATQSAPTPFATATQVAPTPSAPPSPSSTVAAVPKATLAPTLGQTAQTVTSTLCTESPRVLKLAGRHPTFVLQHSS